MQCLGGVRGRVIGLHNRAEAIDRRQGLIVTQIPAANRHFLASQLVANHVELHAGITGILAVWESADHVHQGITRAFRCCLISTDIRDLVEVARRNQVIRILGLGAARMKRKIALGATDRFVIIAGLIMGESRHDHRAAGPFRIRVLALDFVEQQDRLIKVAFVEFASRLIVERLHGAFDIGQFLTALVARLARRQHEGCSGNEEDRKLGGQSHGRAGAFCCDDLATCLARTSGVFQAGFSGIGGATPQTAADRRASMRVASAVSVSQHQAEGVSSSLRTSRLLIE